MAEYTVTASNNLEFSDSISREPMDFNLDVTQNINFNHGTFLTYEEAITQNVEFSQLAEVVRWVIVEGSNAVEFSQSAKVIRNASNNLEFSQSATVILSKGIIQNIEFSDSAIREPMVFNRGAANDLEFTGFGAGYNASDPPHGVCDDEYICDRDHITLSCAAPVITVDLRNPAEDSLNALLNTINRYSRGEELRMNGVHPRFLQLHYDFTKMVASQKDAFIAFYKATAGLEITLIDFCSQEWIGCILDKEIGFDREEGRIEINPGCPETDAGLYSWSFVFEGERVP